MTKDTFTAYPFGTRVRFGDTLTGEIVAVCFSGPAKQPVYSVEWWDSEGNQVVSELYESQFKVLPI